MQSNNISTCVCRYNYTSITFIGQVMSDDGTPGNTYAVTHPKASFGEGGSGVFKRLTDKIKKGIKPEKLQLLINLEFFKMCKRKNMAAKRLQFRKALTSILSKISLHFQRARNRAHRSTSRGRASSSKSNSSQDSGDPDQPADPPAWQFSSHNPHELTPQTTKQNRYFSLRCFSPCCCRMSGGMLI